MFWGTDITRMHCTWRQCVTLFTEELPWLKGRDLDLVMGGVAQLGRLAASDQKLRRWTVDKCMRLLCDKVFGGRAENLPGASKTIGEPF